MTTNPIELMVWQGRTRSQVEALLAIASSRINWANVTGKLHAIEAASDAGHDVTEYIVLLRKEVKKLLEDPNQDDFTKHRIRKDTIRVLQKTLPGHSNKL